MARFLQEIEWEAPLLVAPSNGGFEAELGRLGPWMGDAQEAIGTAALRNALGRLSLVRQ